MSLQSATREGARRSIARNPRRRQRPETDSVGHQPRRKRSKVTSETFDRLTSTNGDDSGEPVSNGHMESRHRTSATPNESLDIPVRAKKISNRRAPKTEGGAVMTQNDHYTLRHLPSTPDIIRKSASDFHGSILPSSSLALVVTREHAYIWDYTSPTPVTRPRTFSTPQPGRAGTPLPLGQLLTTGASSTVGLVLVSAATADITYWENIETADSLSLFQGQNTGAKGVISGLFSGETVTDITSADHAGVLLTLSSGRIAQVSLRDAQGRPCVQSQLLKTGDAGSGGLFNSLKGALGVGWKRDVIGVKTRVQGSKGQIEVISATASAEIQIWDLAWSGHCSHRETIDFKAVLESETDALHDGLSKKPAPISLVDFAVLPTKPNGLEVSLLGDEIPLDLVFIAKRSNTYGLVEVTVAGGKAYVERVTALKGYSARSKDDRARLLIPSPAHSVVIAFSHAFAVMSLSDVTASGPDAQLLNEAHTTPKLFQDVVYLRDSPNTSILGATPESLEDRDSQSQTIFFIKGFGLARLVVSEPTQDLAISVKSRMQQAIFYGTQQNCILDLQRIDRRSYDAEEAEEAALEISQDILASDSLSISSASISIDTHIAVREELCHALIEYLKQHFSPVSRITSWKLFSDAVNLAAGRQLWNAFDAALSSDASAELTVLPRAIEDLKKSRQREHSSTSDLDEVRDWFMHDLQHLDQLYYHSLSLINANYQNHNLEGLTGLISECDDIIINIFDAIYKARAVLGPTYGIGQARIKDGVLETGWEGLPEPWMATHKALNLIDNFVNNARKLALEVYEHSERTSERQDVEKIVRENIRLIEILCRCYRERIAWCSANYTEKLHEYNPNLRDKFRRSRDHHLHGLMNIGQAGAGIAIAEQYGDMEALVNLVMSESSWLIENKDDPQVGPAERAVIAERMVEMEARIKRFFSEYGESFANPFFHKHLSNHRSYGLLQETSLFAKPLTKYLREEPVRGRLGWINEVLITRDLDRAQIALATVAKDHETKLWNKKIELSLSKLTALALAEQSQSQGSPSADGTAMLRVDRGLTITAVQDAIYAHVQPLTVSAMDHDAEVQLVTDTYAVSIRTALPALHQLLEIALEDLLKHVALPVEQLVDLLTLMDSTPSQDFGVDIAGKEFYLALKVLDAAQDDLDENKFQMLLRTIWKRCYLRDDWDLIDKTGGKSESQIAERLRDFNTAGTIALALSDVLAPGSAITISKPEDCVGASSSDKDLEERFPSSDLRDPIIHDNSKQDQQLSKLIEKYNLSKWVKACTAEAKKMAEEQYSVDLGDEQSRGNGFSESPRKRRWVTTHTAGRDDDDSLEDIAPPPPELEQSFAAAAQVEQPAEERAPRSRSPVKKTKANGTVKGKENNDSAPLTEPRKSTRRLRSHQDADGDAEMLLS